MKDAKKKAPKKSLKKLDVGALDKTRGGFGLYGNTANEVLLNAWWDSQAPQ